MKSNNDTSTTTSWQDLNQMAALMGFNRLNKIKNRNKGILKGPFYCQSFPGGLSLHYGSTVELQNSSNSSELPAGISFNLTFEGNVSFALSGKRYCLRSNSKNIEPECCTIIIKKPEVLTRFLTQNTKVTKLNIFIEKSWLKARCSHDEINKIFAIANTVTHWRPSKELSDLARMMINSRHNASLTQKLSDESTALSLADLFISELPMNNEITPDNSPDTHSGALHSQLLQHWSPGMPMKTLAVNMHMSVSTLQRRFKDSYGITVMDYLRKRRLEKARLCLIEQDISIGEAAFIAGYQHSSNFISAFKRSFGLTPKQLIEAHSLH